MYIHACSTPIFAFTFSDTIRKLSPCGSLSKKIYIQEFQAGDFIKKKQIAVLE